MTTLLGFLDSKIKDEFTGEAWSTNKIGGHLCLLSSAIKEEELNDLRRFSICDRCNQKMVFIGQIFCPLETDTNDRYLLMFACNTIKCGQWSILRYQIQNKLDQSTTDHKKLNQEQKFELENNWLDEEDDWNADPNTECSNQENENDKDETVDQESGRQFIVFNEDEMKFIQPYYLNVELESETEDSIKLDKHVNDLLKNYKEKNDKLDQNAIDEYSKMDETDIMENYNNDVQTYRFYKKISLVCGQVIRYCWAGKPLVNSSNVNLDESLICDNCGSVKVFEFQLMPALINYLRFKSDNVPLNLDFASVLVFTCKQNCTNKMLTRESYFILEENDQNIPEHFLTGE